jgi:hypothetical protein
MINNDYIFPSTGCRNMIGIMYIMGGNIVLHPFDQW